MRRVLMSTIMLIAIMLIAILPLPTVSGLVNAQQGEPVAQPADPESVYRAAYDAQNAGDVEACLALYADGAVTVALPPPPGTDGVFVGKEVIRAITEELVARNIHTEFTDFHVHGDSVTFTALVVEDVFRDIGVFPVEFSGTAVVQNGLIQSETWHIRPDSLARLGAAIARLENRAVVERLYEEVFNQRNLDVVDEIYAEQVIDHDFGEATRESLKADFASMFTGLPDLHVTTDVWVMDGDLVTTRVTFSGTHQGEWMDVPATGAHVSWTHIDIHRIQDGKITDIWHTIPVGDMLQQIGFELAPSSE